MRTLKEAVECYCQLDVCFGRLAEAVNSLLARGEEVGEELKGVHAALRSMLRELAWQELAVSRVRKHPSIISEPEALLELILLQALLAQPLTLPELAKSVGLHPSRARQLLYKLKVKGCVREERRGRRRVYAVTEKGVEYLHSGGLLW